MSRSDLLLLDWHRRARSQPLLYRFTLATRILLAVAFIPTGLVKLMGQRFTSMSPDYPIGAFFETLYQSGLYWHFLGLAQVSAGVLVLAPATATLGALAFLPIVANIFVITLSYDFNLTPVITGLMLVANTYLLAWDYDRLRGIFGATSRSEQAEVAPRHRLGRGERAVYVVGTLAALAFFLGTRLSVPPREWAVWSMTVGGSSAAIALWLGWSRRSG